MSHGGSQAQSFTSQKHAAMDTGKQSYHGCTTRIVSLKEIPNLPSGKDVKDETYRQIYSTYVSQSAQLDHGNKPNSEARSLRKNNQINAHLLSCAITSLTTGIAPPVAFPTETVYGLGADATNAESIAGVFAAKGRPSDNPLIVHVSSIDHLERCLGGSAEKSAIPTVYQDLIKEFWPGPLTILLPVPEKGQGVKFGPNVHPGQKTIGFRVPESAYARFVIAAADRPIAAPSANSSGKPSPTAASHVKDDLDGKINFILDGGECDVGVESTVVDGLGVTPLILRPGGLSKINLKSWGQKMNNVWQGVGNGWESKHTVKEMGHDQSEIKSSERPCKRLKLNSTAADMFESPAMRSPSSSYDELLTEQDQPAAPRAPGMKYKHYAPTGRMILLERRDQSSNSTEDQMSKIVEDLIMSNMTNGTVNGHKESKKKPTDVLEDGYETGTAPCLRLAILASSSWSDNNIQTNETDEYSIVQTEVDPKQLGNVVETSKHHNISTMSYVSVFRFQLGKYPELVARNLFACLRACDHLECDFILAEAPFTKFQGSNTVSDQPNTNDDDYETVMERMRKAASEVVLV